MLIHSYPFGHNRIEFTFGGSYVNSGNEDGTDRFERCEKIILPTTVIKSLIVEMLDFQNIDSSSENNDFSHYEVDIYLETKDGEDNIHVGTLKNENESISINSDSFDSLKYQIIHIVGEMTSNICTTISGTCKVTIELR